MRGSSGSSPPLLQLLPPTYLLLCTSRLSKLGTSSRLVNDASFGPPQYGLPVDLCDGCHPTNHERNNFQTSRVSSLGVTKHSAMTQKAATPPLKCVKPRITQDSRPLHRL